MHASKEKGHMALRCEHSFIQGVRASQGHPLLNLVSELSGVRSWLMFLLFLAMVSTFMFTGMDVTLPWRSLDMKQDNHTTQAMT